MALAVESVMYGDVRCHIYTFEKKGDLIPMHNHTRNDVHMSIVARGSIEHFTQNGKTEHPCGTILLINDDSVMHEVRAKEDDTKVINILKYSKEVNLDHQSNAIVI